MVHDEPSPPADIIEFVDNLILDEDGCVTVALLDEQLAKFGLSMGLPSDMKGNLEKLRTMLFLIVNHNQCSSRT